MMRIKDLYKVTDKWVKATVWDVNTEKEVYDGMMLGLEMGIKEKGSENLLFDETLEKVLEMKICEIEILGENSIRIEAMESGK